MQFCLGLVPLLTSRQYSRWKILITLYSKLKQHYGRDPLIILLWFSRTHHNNPLKIFNGLIPKTDFDYPSSNNN